jgi:hypothetical protein
MFNARPGAKRIHSSAPCNERSNRVFRRPLACTLISFGSWGARGDLDPTTNPGRPLYSML